MRLFLQYKIRRLEYNIKLLFSVVLLVSKSLCAVLAEYIMNKSTFLYTDSSIWPISLCINKNYKD